MYFAAVALGIEACGDSETGARAASLTFVLATVFVVWRLGRRMGPAGTGEIAAVALATMPLSLAFGRTVIPDSALLFFETAALAAAWRGFESTGSAQRWFALSWALLGLGLITKGPVVAIVPLLIVTVWRLVTGLPLRPYFTWRAWRWALIAGVPWLIAVSFRRPDFLHYAVVFESWGRLTTGAHGRSGPVWFFVPVLLAGSFPWSVPAAVALVEAVRHRASRCSPERRGAVLAAAWALVPVVFFSVPQSKLAGYILPSLPGVALGVGLFFSRAQTDAALRVSAARSVGISAGILLALAAVALAGVFLAGWIPRLAPSIQQAIPAFALVFAPVLAAAAALAAWGARRHSVWLGAAALAMPVAAVPFTAAPLMNAIGRDRSSLDLAAAIDRAAPGALIVAVAAYPTSLQYYVDRPVLLATANGEEMTSHYIGEHAAEFRALPDSPLRPADWWLTALDACEEPTVFVVRAGAPMREVLAAQLPYIGSGGAAGRFVAYGPCPSRPAGER